MEAEDAGESVLQGAVSVIAVPLADKKLQKRLLKLVKRAAASKFLKRGVKEVVKVLRKADKFKGCVALLGLPGVCACMPVCLLLCVCAPAHPHCPASSHTPLSLPQPVHHCWRPVPH